MAARNAYSQTKNIFPAHHLDLQHDCIGFSLFGFSGKERPFRTGALHTLQYDFRLVLFLWLLFHESCFCSHELGDYARIRNRISISATYI